MKPNIKIFTGSDFEKLEERINQFFTYNKEIEIVFINQTQTEETESVPSYLTITIMYFN